MSNSNIEVSVIITCYNYGRYLNDSISSVLSQSFENLELIIVDDGSTDDTAEKLNDLKTRNLKIPVNIISQENSGNPAYSRNRGIAEARGNYVLCLDADDAIHPQMIEICHLSLKNNKWASFSYTDRRDFDGVDQVVKARPFDRELIPFQNHVSYCALYEKSMWEKIGGYRLNARGGEDWDFWIASALAGFRGFYIPEPLFFYRRHDTGLFQEAKRNFDPIMSQIILNNSSAYNEEQINWAKMHQQ